LPAGVAEKQRLQQAVDNANQKAQEAKKKAAEATAAAKVPVANQAAAEAAARAAEAAAWDSKQAATSLNALKDDVNAQDLAKARQAEKTAQDVLNTEKAKLATAEQKLDTLDQRRKSLLEQAQAREKEALQKAPPQSMQDKLNALRTPAEAQERARQAAENALALARQELQAAEASAPVQQCPWWRVTAVFGEYVPPKAPSALQAEKKVADKQAELDAVSKRTTEESEYQKQKQRVQEKLDEAKRLKDQADTHRKDAAELQPALDASTQDVQRLTSSVAAEKTKAGAGKTEREALEKLDADRKTALQGAETAGNTGLQQARNNYMALGQINELADLDMKTGAAIKTSSLNGPSQTALANFNADPPTTGQKAKQLAALLPTKNRANFVPYMDNEAAQGRCNKRVKGTMLTYEYPDGTEVRYKPNGDGVIRTDPTYSIEVKHTPANPDNGPQDVAFKVDTQGRAVPKNPSNTANPYRGTGGTKESDYDDRCMDSCHRIIPP
jgi:hypothetical protein